MYLECTFCANYPSAHANRPAIIIIIKHENNEWRIVKD